MEIAPEFSLSDQDGNTRSLADYCGRWIVLYFYPKDDTPGCTTEACAFRDEHEAIAQTTDTVVIGISTDSVESHKQFADKYHLTFTLLSDPDHVTIKAYDSWDPVKIGTQRNTFIIDPQGRIAKSYVRVNPDTHVQEVLKDLPKLMSHA